MQASWQAFLAQQGASIAEGAIVHFGHPQQEAQAAADGSIIADLSHLGLLQLDGDDAVTFLQGQVTNDVKLLDGSRSHYTGYCNPKGRMLALLHAFAHRGHLHLQLNGALKESVMKRLKMYVLRSKVAITDVSDDIIRLGVSGTAAEFALQSLFGTLPTAPHELLDHERATLLRLPGTTPRFEVFTKPELAQALWSDLRLHCTPVGRAAWELLEIRAGIPDVTPATLEAFVPQMLNLDLLGGINFKKGCYTGQEIVARTHYLGKVKRRTHLGHANTAQPPNPGDGVYGVDSTEPVGLVVSAAPAPQGGYDLLAEIRLESVEAGTVRLQATDGPAIELLPLPYSLN